jgi:hypothetical protein
MKTTVLLSAFIRIVISASLLGSCSKSSAKPSGTNNTATLYDSLGGTVIVSDPANPGQMVEKGYLLIRNIVDSTVFVIAGDTAINGHFTTLLSEVSMGNLSGFEALSNNLTVFVAVATGAKDYTYGGKSMVDAHNPATNSRMNGKADNGDFNAFVTDLIAGAGKAGVPSNNPALASVGNIVESLRSQIVQQ